MPILCSGTFLFSPSANLSDLYFTNRQDRYVLLQDSPEIADFFTELVDAIGDVSLQLQQDDTVQMMEGMVHPYQGRRASPYLVGWYDPEEGSDLQLGIDVCNFRYVYLYWKFCNYSAIFGN